jgi:glycopeptide antibiotics resistance protein
MNRSFVYAQVVFLLSLPLWLNLTDYLHPIVLGVVWACLTALFLFVSALVKHQTYIVPKMVLQLAILLYSLGLIVLLFFRPENQSYGEINLIPFETIGYYLSGEVTFLIALYNLAANIGLFIPFGLYYGMVKNTPKASLLVLLATGAITVIEGMQFLTKRGSLDIDDLILNLLGVWIGYLIYPLIKKVLDIR